MWVMRRQTSVYGLGTTALVAQPVKSNGQRSIATPASTLHMGVDSGRTAHGCKMEFAETGTQPTTDFALLNCARSNYRLGVRILVAITGASGALYAQRLLENLD